jgi:hypothetical protein
MLLWLVMLARIIAVEGIDGFEIDPDAAMFVLDSAELLGGDIGIEITDKEGSTVLLPHKADLSGGWMGKNFIILAHRSLLKGG